MDFKKVFKMVGTIVTLLLFLMCLVFSVYGVFIPNLLLTVTCLLLSLMLFYFLRLDFKSFFEPKPKADAEVKSENDHE